ncbi:MAG: cyclase family protein [Actinomycetales bacterium]|nr:cyclase family protein [Actinomycetales bacterium]
MKIIRVVDLSHALTETTQVYPGDPTPHLEQHSTIERDGFNLMSVSMGSQSGTHVDAPYHFDETTKRIDELDLSLFVGPAVILDCGALTPRARISRELVQDQLGQIRSGDMVIFKTQWSRHYGTDAYFENPFIDAELVGHLLEIGVRTFGLDAINIDETPDDLHPGEGFPCHHLIAEAGGVICENLTNLESVNFKRPLVSILPLKFIGIDGAPVRAVAIEQEN